MNILCSEEGMCEKQTLHWSDISGEGSKMSRNSFFLKYITRLLLFGTRKLLYQLICGFDKGYLTVRYQGNISNDTITEKKMETKRKVHQHT